MGNMTVPKLVLRLQKGQPLTAAEHDENLKTLRDFANSLSNLFGISLNTDGTLKDNSVSTGSLKDRSVTKPKLSLDALSPYADTGVANSLVITPTPNAASYIDGMVFFIKVKFTNTGATTLRVAGNATSKSILKKGTAALDAGDLIGGSVICVAYDQTSDAFHLISGSSTSGSGGGGATDTNFTGLNRYTSDEVALGAGPYTFLHGLDDIPASAQVWLKCAAADGAYAIGDRIPGESITAGTEATSTLIALAGADPLTFAHGLGANPDSVQVFMECIVADGTYAEGDRIPAHSVLTAAAGAPMFAINAADSTTIEVRRLGASYYSNGALLNTAATKWALRIVAKAGTGPKFSIKSNLSSIVVTERSGNYYAGDTKLTAANWKLVVDATRTFNEATFYFPAQEFLIAGNVSGAMSHKNNLWSVKAGASGQAYVTKLPLAGGAASVLPLNPLTPYPATCNPALFRRDNGHDAMVFTSDKGTYVIDLTSPVDALRFSSSAGSEIYRFKPAQVVESGGNISEVYAVGSRPGESPAIKLNVIPCRLITAGSIVAHGTPLDLTSTDINYWNGAVWAGGNVEFLKWNHTARYLTLFQYNPVSRRIYVISTESGLLHIFRIMGTDAFKDWWALSDAVRAASLRYVKAIPICGNGASGAVGDSEAITVEFDLDTGVEKAIAWTNYGTAGRQSSIVRATWRETSEDVDNHILD